MSFEALVAVTAAIDGGIAAVTGFGIACAHACLRDTHDAARNPMVQPKRLSSSSMLLATD
jgi:hypothetical protein